jgi:hypothetical protein
MLSRTGNNDPNSFFLHQILLPYDINNINSQITNTLPNSEIYTFLPTTLTQLAEYHSKYSNLFQEIVLLTKLTCKPFVEQKLIPTSLVKCAQFQLFGADILFTDQMKPFMLELNKGPDMRFVNQSDFDLKQQIHNDMFQLIFKKSNTTDFVRIVFNEF